MIFYNLLGQAFWQEGKKTFISGATRLPATDLGVLFDLLGEGFSHVKFSSDNRRRSE